MKKKIEAKTQIGTIECPGCGRKDLPVKVNVAGCVYYFCAAVLSRDENGKVKEKCLTRMNYGREASQRIIAEYLQENEKHATENQLHETEPDAGQSREPDTIPDSDEGGNALETDAIEKGSNIDPAITKQPDGFGGAIKHFFTGE